MTDDHTGPDLKIGPIICGLCGHEIERATFYRDESDMTLVMVARCHGKTDERRISDHDKSLNEAGALKHALASGGTAFDQTKLIPRGTEE